ncbi:MAG: GNAT family N-acetyltransferase [Sandaracinaceae bacterium]
MRWTETLRRAEVLAAPRGSHVLPENARIVRGDGWYQVVTPGASAGLNEVVQARLEEDEVEARVDDVFAQYAAVEARFKWVLGPDSSPLPVLTRALERRGMVSWWAAGMCAALERLETRPPNGVVVTEVHGAESQHAWARIFAEGWGGAADHHVARARLGPQRPCFTAWIDGVPVGVAAYHDKGLSAYLMDAVVLPAFRGRGAYRALLAARVASARARGLTLATTHARVATSQPVLETAGFDEVFRYRMFGLPD